MIIRAGRFALMCVDMLLAQLLLATSDYAGIVVGVTLTGLCGGAIWTLLPLVMADLFGLDHVGANYKIAVRAATPLPCLSPVLVLVQPLILSPRQSRATLG